MKFTYMIAMVAALATGAAWGDGGTVEADIGGGPDITVVPGSPFDDGSAVQAQQQMFAQEGRMLDYGVNVASQGKSFMKSRQAQLSKAISSNDYNAAFKIFNVSVQVFAQAQAIDAQIFRYSNNPGSPAYNHHMEADADLAAAKQTLDQMWAAILPVAQKQMGIARAAQVNEDAKISAMAAAERSAATAWDNRITGSLGETQACFANGTPPTGVNCNVFAGRTLETVYGFSDFKASGGGYMDANQIADFLMASPNWTMIGKADDQSVLAQAANSAASLPVVAVLKNPKGHGHIVFVGPGPLEPSSWVTGSTHLLVPNAAGFSMESPKARFIGDRLSSGFRNDDKSSVLIYVRTKP